MPKRALRTTGQLTIRRIVQTGSLLPVGGVSLTPPGAGERASRGAHNPPGRGIETGDGADLEHLAVPALVHDPP